jgi:molecular chaperone DnaK
MVKDAERHAEEDRKLRGEVEARNEADALAFQAERTLKDLGDKVSAEDRAAVESQVATLREALKGSDTDAINAGMQALVETLSRVSTAAYQAADSGSNGDGSSGDGSAGPAESEGEGEPAGARSGGDGGDAGDETVKASLAEVQPVHRFTRRPAG